MVCTYQDMDELLSNVVKVDKMLGEIGKTPYEPLHEEKEEELSLGKTNIDKQLQVFNETLVNYFGQGTNGNKGPSLGMTSII